MTITARNTFSFSCAFGFAALISMSCTSRPPAARPEPKPESKIVIPPAPNIALKSYHRSMLDEMRQSFERADEIVIGIYTGNFTDGPQGRVFYFDQFRTFNKETWTWGPEMNALLPILFLEVRPEIITSREFKSLSELDKIGICWDDFEGPRSLYLVEGIQTLVFLRQVLDETERSSRRILIDTYPVTKDCKAKDIFDLMLIERAGKQDTLG